MDRVAGFAGWSVGTLLGPEGPRVIVSRCAVRHLFSREGGGGWWGSAVGWGSGYFSADHRKATR